MNGFAKSPIAVLLKIFVTAAYRCTPHSSAFSRLALGAFCCAIFCSGITGCSLFRNCSTESCCSDEGDCLMAASYQAVDRLVAAIPDSRQLPRNRPVIVATLVDIDKLAGSRLGRTLSEHLSTRMTKHGFKIVEMKLRDSIFVKQSEGELLLSREIKEIGRNHDAQALLVGTYSESRGRVYVSIRLVGAVDGMVISAQDYLLPIDGNVRALLWGSAM